MGDVVRVPGRISLDGEGWRCRPLLGDEWQHLSVGEPALPGHGGWLAATVPGTVVADLWRAGEVPDPYFERNSRCAEWAAERWWAYQTDFATLELGADERVQLVLEGLDHAGRVYLDGELLGEHEGMFVPARFEVGERLRGTARDGDDALGRRHVLDVLMAPAPPSESQSGDTARVRVHKSRMSYGWDFCPRLVQQGIWRPVWLRRTGPIRIERPWVRTELADDHASATLRCAVELDSSATGTAEVSVIVGRDGQAVAETGRRLEVGGAPTVIDLAIELDRPVLWWPNGYGDQPLYDVELRVSVDGRPSDTVRLQVGVRSLRLEPNDGAPPDARPYTLVVNGQQMYMNGWNWVPIDMLYGVPRPAKLQHLLRLARDAHVTLLRVWGGGLIEGEDFYRSCDRLGLLVWQEFSQSSSGLLNEPAENPEFVALMSREAEQIVPERRNHTSLALWCGGNELMRDGVPLDESAPVLAALADVVRRLDPDRPFLPSSPSGPLADFPRLEPGELGHDVHGPWEHQGLEGQQRLYESRAAMLHSEFGVEGVANLATLEATIAPQHRWPATRDNPVHAHRGAWWINEPLVQASFGGGIDDLVTLVRASQQLQADGLRYAVETHLRRRWRNSGTLPWQFNEPFPNAWCTSAVDYYGRAKPAYHAVAAAYEPLHASAAFERVAWAGATDFEARLWVTSSLRQPQTIRLLARCLAADGTEVGRLKEDVDLAPLGALEVGTLSAPLADMATDVFLLDLALERRDDGAGLSANRYLFSRTPDLGPLRRLPPATIQVGCAGDDDAWLVSLRNAAEVLAAGLRLEDARPVGADGWALPASGPLDLLPGEQRAVRVRFDDVPATERRLRIAGWNVEELLLD